MPAERFRPRAGKIQMILTSTLSGFRASAVIPVFLITGALGSGKTTLLREMLACPDMQDTALIINEFGAIGLDQMLVQSAIENILLMEDGCLCCSIRGDLIDTIGGLFAKVELGEIPSFGRIIIETTGLADPGQIIQDLVTARGVANRIRLAKVVTTVDGVLGLSQLDQNEEVVQQVIHADLCMITKCDLIDGETLSVLTRAISGFNPTAEIVRSNDPGEPNRPGARRDAVEEIPASGRHRNSLRRRRGLRSRLRLQSRACGFGEPRVENVSPPGGAELVDPAQRPPRLAESA